MSAIEPDWDTVDAIIIRNDAGEAIATVSSDAEAARWFLEQGRKGDYLDETGELLSTLVGEIFADVAWHYDRYGAVETTWATKS